MSLLLDTSVFLWWALDSRRLGAPAREAIATEGEVLVSAATGFEIATKTRLGKLRFEGDVLEQIERNGFGALAISVEHGVLAGGLPPHHRDPFDRILIAQSRLERLTVVTPDPVFARYGVPVLAA